MSRIFWIRHGPTHAKTMVGWSDLPADLSDTAQLARIERHLPSKALVISSDLSRAVTTADAIAGDRHRLPHDRNLREMHFGDWELKHHSEIEDQDHARRFWENPGDIRPPGGESWNEVTARVDTAISRVLTDHPGADIIAVAHFGVILTQLQQALQLDAYQAFAHKIDNLSVTELHRAGDSWHAEHFNHHP
ncbi:histidine phosphatase family protein [Alisedimentitalea sp. MJ-SS2]|uniref:histidine phosphatase family protein n=1 Tax=Aliisedimentitalea sp. MJ-SS2 TaxID=3049795 RepID=UPI0029132F27|nr:histidine phosphatase family protein [Alisedimentitalea sp. MJ-SS2]MDU8928816.1 histidine phosphatase family protein [Alisedimentitalea sp. MJ-SS2]